MLKDSLIKFLKLDSLVNNLTGYVETRIELMKVEVKEDLAKVLAKVVIFLLVAFFTIIFVLFLSIAMAAYLATVVGEFGGFAIVGGIYLIVAIIVFAMRENLSQACEKLLIQALKKKQ